MCQTQSRSQNSELRASPPLCSCGRRPACPGRASSSPAKPASAAQHHATTWQTPPGTGAAPCQHARLLLEGEAALVRELPLLLPRLLLQLQRLLLRLAHQACGVLHAAAARLARALALLPALLGLRGFVRVTLAPAALVPGGCCLCALQLPVAPAVGRCVPARAKPCAHHPQSEDPDSGFGSGTNRIEGPLLYLRSSLAGSKPQAGQQASSPEEAQHRRPGRTRGAPAPQVRARRAPFSSLLSAAARLPLLLRSPIPRTARPACP